MAQLSQLTHSSLFEPFWKTVEYTPLGAIVDCVAVAGLPLFFWKESLKHIAHNLGVGLVPEKSVRTFLTRVNPTSDQKRFKSRGKTAGKTGSEMAAPVDGWIPLKRTNRALLQAGLLHFFREEVFPPTKNMPGAKISYYLAPGSVVRIGAWRCDFGSAIEGPAPPLLSEGLNVRTVMRGSFSYALPCDCTTLTTTYSVDDVTNGQGKPSASRRPLPLKTVDVELVRGMPLFVCNKPDPTDAVAVAAEGKEDGHCVVSYTFMPVSRKQYGSG